MKAFRPTCHTQHTDITRCTSRLTAPEPPPNAIKPLLRTPKTLSMHFTAFCPDSGELSGRSGQEWSSAGHFIISMATGGHCNVYFSFYIVCPRIPPMMCTTRCCSLGRPSNCWALRLCKYFYLPNGYGCPARTNSKKKKSAENTLDLSLTYLMVNWLSNMKNLSTPQ